MDTEEREAFERVLGDVEAIARDPFGLERFANHFAVTA
jgi:hypothetical protein